MVSLTNQGINAHFRIEYLLFLLPFVLAFLSWLLYPMLSNWLITTVFNYRIIDASTNSIWDSLISFFYAWYTLVAIGVSGTFVVAAHFSRKKPIKSEKRFNPLVSFVIPAFNQEKNVYKCITSLYDCTDKFNGICEIIVVDDGSNDCTYEIAKSAIKLGKSLHPHIGGKVFHHAANLGKVEALKTGIKRAMGDLIAIVDADSEWEPETLTCFVDYKLANGKKAVTGYAHPNGVGQESKGNLIVKLQRLEYSQSLGIGRCAQSLNDNVLVVSGVIGLYDSTLLREILMDQKLQSVTEDLEITLQLHRKGAKVGYVNFARGSTVAPTKLSALWHQRMRWFTGWIHNTIGIHRELLTKKSWLSALMWYSYIFEYAGAFIDILFVCSFIFLWNFAPDPAFFGLNMLMFLPYGLLIGIVNQAIALRFTYGTYTGGKLLLYTPLYAILRLVNMFARSGSIVSYLLGNHGKWHVEEQ